MDEKTREGNRLRQRKYLELHKDEVNQKRRERYHERINLGRCPRCGGKVKKGQTLCTGCCEYMLDLNKKYANEKKAGTKVPVKAVAKPTAKAAAKPKAKAPVKTAVKVPAKAVSKPKAKATVKAAAKPKGKAPAKKR